MRRSGTVAVAGIVVLLVLLAWPAAALAAHVTERVSLDSSEAQVDGNSTMPSVSTDGRYVAFESVATNLVAGDTNSRSDIFVRDRVLGTTERVSVSGAEAQANGHSYCPSISADGRYVAFESVATNLVAGDTNSKSDVFVRDRVLGTTVRVSRSTGGTQGNGDSYSAAISADGRYVAFHSLATNLVGGDSNATCDVFERDLLTGATSRVSVSSAEAQANGGSDSPSISADGRYVAFSSEATNLWSGDTNGKEDIFVRDRVAGTTARISLSSGGVQADDDCYGPSISADGRYVAYHSDATTLVIGDTNGCRDVFVHERETGFTTRESLSTSEGQGNGDSHLAAISANGRYVVFSSGASNLTADTNGKWDVFIRDRETGTTFRASVSTAMGQGNGHSGFPAISVDGRTVAFRSEATSLVAGDTNGVADVFSMVRDPTLTYISIRGSDRYDTAIRLSQAGFT